MMVLRLLSLMVLLVSVPACAEEAVENPADAPAAALSVENAYAYATTSVQKNGAVFLELSNTAEWPAQIIKAEGDVAERIELHTHTMDGDMMMMREVEQFEVPAGGTLTLKPMGDHIMLMGLKEPLKAGSSFPLTLGFNQPHFFEPLEVTVEVKNPSEMKADMMDDMTGDMH